jgi:hypothetical protein
MGPQAEQGLMGILGEEISVPGKIRCLQQMKDEEQAIEMENSV